VEVLVLASGSSGNAVVVRSGGTAVLVDAGVSATAIRRRMAAFGMTPADLDAVLLTHEHTDHVRGLEVLLKRTPLPVWATPGTASRLAVGAREGGDVSPGRAFAVGTLTVLPVPTCHDAAEPVAYVFDDGRHRLGLCTDTGIATTLLRRRLEACHALLLEANHDVDLLRHGPYPWPLKQRIRSRLGHLSNEQGAELAAALAWRELCAVVGLHLSEKNNDPALAREVLRAAVGPGVPVEVAPRDVMVRLLLDGGRAEVERCDAPAARSRRGAAG